jgi:hypothetical protein
MGNATRMKKQPDARKKCSDFNRKRTRIVKAAGSLAQHKLDARHGLTNLRTATINGNPKQKLAEEIRKQMSKH